MDSYCGTLRLCGKQYFCGFAGTFLEEFISNEYQMTNAMFKRLNKHILSKINNKEVRISLKELNAFFSLNLNDIYENVFRDQELLERSMEFLNSAIKSIEYSIKQILRRTKNDFTNVISIEMTSADFRNNSLPWIITTDTEKLVYKPRDMSIDQMIAHDEQSLFTSINQLIMLYSLRTHKISNKEDEEGRYGYASYVNGITYRMPGTIYLKGELTEFFRKLIESMNTHSLTNKLEDVKEVIDYLLLHRVGKDFGLSSDWHHENILFNEENLNCTVIDLEVVSIHQQGSDILLDNLKNQMLEYVKKEELSEDEEKKMNDDLLQKLENVQLITENIYS